MQLVKDHRDKEVRVKVTAKQLETIKEQSAELGLTMADYIRYCLSKVEQQGG